MKPLRSSLSAALASGLLCLAAACDAGGTTRADEPADRPELGLMGTIPIFWGETDDFGELLAAEGAPHWARAELEKGYRLRPLDTLSEEGLAGLDFVMLAQPRVLSAEENVALDAWVRRGGRLLLFADPMLAGESRFAIGDRRRPQGVALLSPLLDHWGLELRFDDEVQPGYSMAATEGPGIPVNLPGSFALRKSEADCGISAGGVLARCSIGRGRAAILADADLLDLHEPHPGAAASLGWLLEQSFRETGDGTGNP